MMSVLSLFIMRAMWTSEREDQSQGPHSESNMDFHGSSEVREAAFRILIASIMKSHEAAFY